MIAEHSRVVLLIDLPREGLVAGYVGTVVHCYSDGGGYEVEFFALDGHTTAVAKLDSGQVRPVNRRDMAHTRELEVA